MTGIAAFIDQLPKAELHLHLEGTLEPELKFELAARNGVSLPYASAGQMRAGYAFRDLTSFLAAYYEGMSAAELKTMLDRSLRATVNSDDPAYFGAYVNQNLTAAAEAADLTVAELAQLARNSFQIAWITPAGRDRYLADLDAYVRQAAL